MKWIIALTLILMAGASAFMLGAAARFPVWIATEAVESKQAIPPTEFRYSYSEFERAMIRHGLVDINKWDDRLIVNPVYAGENNLTGTVLYKDTRRLFIRPEIAAKLKLAQDYLYVVDSSLRLVILDAARPQEVQYRIWQWAAREDKKKYIAAPGMGSVHNYGCAVDVTISGADSLLDMGSKFDHFGPEAEPRYQYDLHQQGLLTAEHIDNRLLLKQIMRQAGFRAIQTEWWHFNGVSKEFAREHFELIP